MRTWYPRTCLAAAIGAVLLMPATGRSEEPAMNRLSGVVVDKASGEAVGGVAVAMAHGDKGFVYFSPDGLRSGGADEKVLVLFTKRNGRHSCAAVTDSAGRFTLTNFAAADEDWQVAAGDAERGWALQLGVHPQDYVDRPLRLELDKAAYVTAAPPAPPSKGLRMDVSVSVVPPEAPRGAPDQAAEPGDAVVQVYFGSPTEMAKEGKEVRLGPLPGGFKYRVTAGASGTKLPYQATMFSRIVAVTPGATETVSLASTEGATVTGRVTSIEDKPLGKVNVTAEAEGGLVIGALTDDEGRYELRGVPPGAHTLKLLRHAVRTAPG